MSGGLGAFRDSVTASSRKAAGVAGAILVRAWKQTLTTPGKGRTYKRPSLTRGGALRRSKRTGRVIYRTHRASAPGDPPAPDYGALRNSIQMQVIGAGALVRVGTGLAYARYLEYGTTRVQPRPHARPALAAAKKSLGEAVVATLRDGGRLRRS